LNKISQFAKKQQQSGWHLVVIFIYIDGDR